jgi:hypothetical protein
MGAEDILIGDVINDTNASVLDFLSPELVSRIDSLVTLLKITGIVIIGYIVFLIIRWFFGIRRHRRINKIYRKVYEIDQKLDVLLKRKLVKEDKKLVEKRKDEGKPGFINRLFKKNKKGRSKKIGKK